jgi:hypothetical protein
MVTWCRKPEVFCSDAPNVGDDTILSLHNRLAGLDLLTAYAAYERSILLAHVASPLQPACQSACGAGT